MQSNGTPTRYPRAVGKQPEQPELGAWFNWPNQFQKPIPLLHTPATDKFWNAGVNMAYGRRAQLMKRRAHGAPSRFAPGQMKKERTGFSFWQKPPAPGVEQFNRAATLMAYGNMGEARAELGDFFNDVMGAVIPGWDSRPDWMKQIQIKPDAAKVIAMAQKVAPNAGEKIVKAANKIGLGVYVNTPAGQMEVTPQNAQNLYGLYPFVTQARSAVGSVPMWVWLAGGGGLLALFLLRR